MKQGKKEKMLDRKWRQMEKLGMKRPKSSEENAQRARDAHVPRDIIGSEPEK